MHDLWTVCAILVGLYAKTRGRSFWAWGMLATFIGPLAFFLLGFRFQRRKSQTSFVDEETGDRYIISWPQ